MPRNTLARMRNTLLRGENSLDSRSARRIEIPISLQRRFGRGFCVFDDAVETLRAKDLHAHRYRPTKETSDRAPRERPRPRPATGGGLYPLAGGGAKALQQPEQATGAAKAACGGPVAVGNPPRPSAGETPLRSGPEGTGALEIRVPEEFTDGIGFAR